MSIVDLLSMAAIGEPQLAPNGDLLYLLYAADWQTRTTVSQLWRVTSDSSHPQQLTWGPAGVACPRWSPDGRQIAFLADANDAGRATTQIFLLNSSGGERRQLTRHPTAAAQLAWSPDGAWIYFLADDEPTPAQCERAARNDVFAFEANYVQRHVWRVASSGGPAERITTGDYTVDEFALSPNGARLVVHRGPTPLLDDLAAQGEIWLAAADGSGLRRLIDPRWAGWNGRLSPDGTQLLFLSHANQHGEGGYDTRVFLLAIDATPPQRLLGDLPLEVIDAAWSADGRTILVLANTGVRQNLFQLDPTTQELTQLTYGDHTIEEWSYLPALDQHVFIINQPNSPGDVWVLDTGGEPRPATQHFADLAQRFVLPRQEAISWLGADGVTVEGLLFYPLDYQPGQRYPLVVQTHGGPAFSDKFAFFSHSSSRYAIPALTALGYLVLSVNYRGSSGYGDAFLRDVVGHYFHQMHLDVMTGADALIEQGLADGERLAKIGYSAGGVLTKKLITYTDRFKAASAGAGATSWLSMYYLSDLRSHRHHWFAGPPWGEGAMRYWEQSPLRDVAGVTTPTLLFYAENDARNPLSEGITFYRALRGLNVPTHLYVVPGKGHNGWDLHHYLFKANAEVAWFERWLMGRDYVAEQPPG